MQRNFETILAREGLHQALRFLNARTPYRFTGVYRYDGETLRNLALFDRRSPEEDQGADAPMRETYCAIAQDAGGELVVANGRDDTRFPWMQANAVVSYCGAVIEDGDGEPFGTICHFDLDPCEAIPSEVAVLKDIGGVVLRHWNSTSGMPAR